MWCCICMGKFNQSDFFQKKHAFLQFCIIFEKHEQECRHSWNDSSQNDGFYNTYAACAGTLKTLLAVDEKTLFCAFTGGRMKPETRADEGSERCCCCCCCCGCCCCPAKIKANDRSRKTWDSFPFNFCKEIKARDGSRKYPRKALGAREGRYVPAKGAMYPRRALRTREGRYVPAKGFTHPRRALCTYTGTREGRYVPAKGATSVGAMYPRRAL